MAKLKKRDDGRYAKQVFLGSIDGKKKYKTVYGMSVREVEEKAVQLRLQLHKGIDIDASRDTFQMWAQRMQATKKTEGIGRSHQDGLKRCCEYLDSINAMELTKIQVCHIQEIINRLSDYHEGMPPLSKSYLIKIKGAASSVFKLAIESRVVDFNPAEYVKIPKTASETRRQAITEEQRSWILSTEHRAKTAAMIMLYAGLRRGELIALTWSDVDLSERTISVNKSVELVENAGVVKSTKTAAGVRVVHIPIILKEYLEQIPRNHLYVCANASGGRCTKVAWRSLWESYMVERHKIAKNSPFNFGGIEFTPHQLRHTFCTDMYFAGVDVLTARDQMGHADIKTTLSIYTHLDHRYKKESMNKMDEYYTSQMQVKA